MSDFLRFGGGGGEEGGGEGEEVQHGAGTPGGHCSSQGLGPRILRKNKKR